MRHVALQGVVGGGLIGQRVRHQTGRHQVLQQIDGVGLDGDRDRLAAVAGRQRPLDGGRDVRRHGVEIAGGEPALDARAVDLGDQADPLVHGHGERLRAAHAAEAGGDGEPAGERAAEVLAGALGEGLVGPLEDPLGADVDPRAGGHLAVHGEAEPLQAAELVGGGPVGHQHRVGDQHPRRLRVGLEHRHRLAGLDEQRLLVRPAASASSTIASKHSQLRAAFPEPP